MRANQGWLVTSPVNWKYLGLVSWPLGCLTKHWGLLRNFVVLLIHNWGPKAILLFVISKVVSTHLSLFRQLQKMLPPHTSNFSPTQTELWGVVRLGGAEAGDVVQDAVYWINFWQEEHRVDLHTMKLCLENKALRSHCCSPCWEGLRIYYMGWTIWTEPEFYSCFKNPWVTVFPKKGLIS